MERVADLHKANQNILCDKRGRCESYCKTGDDGLILELGN